MSQQWGRLRKPSASTSSTANWSGYPPGSTHNPTLSGGDAYILYLLPEGAIEFTGG